jgi:hypothetical protein
VCSSCYTAYSDSPQEAKKCASEVGPATMCTFRYGMMTMANTMKPAIMPIGLFSHAITLKGTTFCRSGGSSTRLDD